MGYQVVGTSENGYGPQTSLPCSVFITHVGGSPVEDDSRLVWLVDISRRRTSILCSQLNLSTTELEPYSTRVCVCVCICVGDLYS